LSDTSRFETVDSDEKETSSDVHLVRHATKNTQDVDEQIILLLGQVSWVGKLGATLDYLAQNRTTCNHNKRFRNESDRTRLS